MKVLVTFGLLLIVCVCCTRQSHDPILGNYELVGHDLTGKLIFTGNISFTARHQMDLQGQCKLVPKAPDFEGSVDKDGPCEGTLADNKITIYTAPLLADGGLTLQGEVNDNRITGSWTLESFAGGTQGKFEAVRKR